MINILVPMAGLGSRFATIGEALPKPLIEVLPGRPMIEYVVDFLSLDEPHRFIFVCLAEHDRQFGLASTLRSRVPECEIVLIDGLTRGPAATALAAAPLVGDDAELLVAAYCDSFLTIELADFLAWHRRRGAAGGIAIYPSNGQFESYAVLGTTGAVVQTAEKQVISPYATAGFYYFKHGAEFVSATRSMIEAADEDSPEFFVCPVYNVLIAEGKTISAYPIGRQQQIEMGTPEDLALSREWLTQHLPRPWAVDAA